MLSKKVDVTSLNLSLYVVFGTVHSSIAVPWMWKRQEILIGMKKLVSDNLFAPSPSSDHKPVQRPSKVNGILLFHY